MKIEAENQQQLSIGQMLHQARTGRGLSVQQVASQLNLSQQLITQLEQDQFNGNMQETYVKGYIRAYAKLLKIPEKQLKAAFNRDSAGHQHVAKPMQTFSNRSKRQLTDKRFIWLTYCIIALFVVLLFVWWWQTEADIPTWTADPVASEVLMPSTTQQAQQNRTNKEVTSSATVAAEQDNDKDLTNKILDSDINLLQADTANAEQQSLAQSEQNAVLAENETAVVESVEATLNIRFSDVCWVNIIDAAGERLAFGTKGKGYAMTLKGKAPFVITLGNPAVVTINYNQQPYDISALPKGRVAKFTIPGSE